MRVCVCACKCVGGCWGVKESQQAIIICKEPERHKCPDQSAHRNKITFG